MFFRILIALAVTATSAFALPTLPARQESGPCAGLSSTSFDTTTCNFTITALNTTLSNTNTTGAPLVVGFKSYSPSGYFSALSTWRSYRYNDAPDVALLPGNVDDPQLRVTDLSVAPGGFSRFQYSTNGTTLPAPVDAYCAVNDSSAAYPIVALNGVSDAFSLCQSTSDAYLGQQNNVVFQASADNCGLYYYNTCYPVKLQLVYH